MKKMFFSLILVMSVCYVSKAQERAWGLRLGSNFATFNEKVDEGSATDYKYKAGFRLGVIRDFGISENFYIQPGLYFTMGGAIQKTDRYQDLTCNLGYLHFPVLLSYRIGLNDYTKLHLNAGPYLAYGVCGKMKYAGEKINAFGDGEYEGGLKRFDAGLSFSAGISFDRFYWSIGYDLGLTEIFDEDSWELNGVKTRNRNIFISLGYNF